MKTRPHLAAALALALVLSLITALSHAAPKIHEFAPGSLQRVIDSHKGKPFVLVVWALECAYCPASLRTLSNAMRTRGDLEVVTLATDSLAEDDNDARIVEHLKAVGLTGEAWAFGAAPAQLLRHALDPKWHGETPRSYWFDAKGQRVAMSGAITDAVIAKMLPLSAP